MEAAAAGLLEGAFHTFTYTFEPKSAHVKLQKRISTNDFSSVPTPPPPLHTSPCVGMRVYGPWRLSQDRPYAYGAKIWKFAKNAPIIALPVWLTRSFGVTSIVFGVTCRRGQTLRTVDNNIIWYITFGRTKGRIRSSGGIATALQVRRERNNGRTREKKINKSAGLTRRSQVRGPMCGDRPEILYCRL